MTSVEPVGATYAVTQRLNNAVATPYVSGAESSSRFSSSMACAIGHILPPLRGAADHLGPNLNAKLMLMGSSPGAARKGGTLIPPSWLIHA